MTQERHTVEQGRNLISTFEERNKLAKNNAKLASKAEPSQFFV